MRSALLVGVLSGCVLLSACAGGAAPQVSPPAAAFPPRDGAPSRPAPSSPKASPGDPVELRLSPTIEHIRQRGKLLVGVRSDAPVFARRDGADRSGFDVEIARILAAGLGLDPRTGVSFRFLPPTLRADAVSTGSTDVQLGGFDPGTPGMAAVGPYVVTGPPGEATEHFIGIAPGDRVLREELERILREAVADGSWQRAYDAALGAAGVPGRPPELPR